MDALNPSSLMMQRENKIILQNPQYALNFNSYILNINNGRWPKL
jgi:hypothetical protein